MEKLFFNDLVFQIWDFIPLGYEIWNIGSLFPDGYLPLCMLKAPAEQPFPGAREIRTDNLKAIKVPEAQTVLEVAKFGLTKVEFMEQYVKRHSGSENEALRVRLECTKAALEVLRSLKR